MSVELYRNCLQDILTQIGDNVTEVSERKLFADLEEQDYIFGKHQAYVEVMAIIQTSMKEHGLSDVEQA